MISLTIRQEPQRGRSSGFSARSGRCYLSPSLIVELKAEDIDINDIIEHCICHVNLVDSHSNESRELIYLPNCGETRPIFDGKRSTVGRLLYDPDDDSKKKLFFVFPDLSVDIPGRFRLKIHAFVLNSNCYAEIYSNIFESFTPKKYPGVLKPSALSRSFAAQGVKTFGKTIVQ